MFEIIGNEPATCIGTKAAGRYPGASARRSHISWV